MTEDGKQLNLSQRELQILEFWEKNKIFEKSLEKTKKGKRFIFYEGPPTANGRPGIHHVITRAFKDIMLRYKTMRGFFVSRRAGWDTHGLPVEIEVEKQLGFKHKQDIEKYGIAKFNRKAKESVWRYKDEWEKFTKRIGFWLDMEHPYITYDTSYIETLWWIIKEIWKKGLLYQDFKVTPWCPRCETVLSSHEVGLGYKKVKENSVYVKLKLAGRKNEYLLVWTTTPWTLPANVAVAVNPKIDYTKYRIKNNEYEYLWSAMTPPYDKNEVIEVVEKVSGKSLLGLKYESLYTIPKKYSLGRDPEFITIPGDFVSTKEGTGMVHLAPAFGEEDMAAAKKFWQDSYPILLTVNTDGTVKKGIVGEGKFMKDADSIIIEDLKKRGFLYRVEPYEHDYPFCWRCSTPLLYFARTAWWVRIGALRPKILENNEKINWIPEHLKHGRFGEFLNEIRDWAFSRERYWGTPLPIWICKKCSHQEVVASMEELSCLAPRAKNRYLIMRHGEALSNVKNVITYTTSSKYTLTLEGRVQVERSAKKIKNKNVDLIFSSDLMRTKETARIVADELKIQNIFFDPRLREINTGTFEDQKPEEYQNYFSSMLEKFSKRPPGKDAENLSDVRRRMLDFIEEIEKKYSGKTILLVSHEYPLWAFYGGALGLSNEDTILLRRGARTRDFIHFAEVMETDYRILPRDENGEVNLHRPYVDQFQFMCSQCDGVMKRVSEVVDVWFDSGSMPYAQEHFPFNRAEKLVFPADYICEAVDQTRGWFYTLLAVSTLLGKGNPYKNVISLGHILDKNGQKMSKSKGNVVEPDTMMEKYGADALRWYFFTVNPPGEPKRFDEKDLSGKLRGFLGTFWNSFIFFDTYVDKVKITNQNLLPQRIQGPQSSKAKTLAFDSKKILDKWVLAKLNLLVGDVTRKLDSYDITGAARAIEYFAINDFSQWYLRRSRKRFQHPESKQETDNAASITVLVLLILCKLIAPFAPFISEIVYQELKKKVGLKDMSVHLAEWPIEVRLPREALRVVKDMEIVRAIVAQALKMRAEAGIKVRQPLRELRIKNQELQDKAQLLDLIKDEVNVKEVIFGDELKLDTTITPELKEEGIAREIIRNIQEMRKDLGLKPKNKIRAQFASTKEIDALLERWQKIIKEQVGAVEFKIGGKKIFKAEREPEIGGVQIWIGIA